MLPLLLTTSLLQPVTVPQDHVHPVFGCGASCRVETEQLGLPEPVGDGWIRLKVRQRTWMNLCDPDSGVCRDEPASAPMEPVKDVWLFANCEKSLFSTSKTPERRQETEQVVWHSDGSPKHQTVYGCPFQQWAPLCPAQSQRGVSYLRQIYQQFRDAIDEIRRNTK